MAIPCLSIPGDDYVTLEDIFAIDRQTRTDFNVEILISLIIFEILRTHIRPLRHCFQHSKNALLIPVILDYFHE